MSLSRRLYRSLRELLPELLLPERLFPELLRLSMGKEEEEDEDDPNESLDEDRLEREPDPERRDDPDRPDVILEETSGSAPLADQSAIPAAGHFMRSRTESIAAIWPG